MSYVGPDGNYYDDGGNPIPDPATNDFPGANGATPVSTPDPSQPPVSTPPPIDPPSTKRTSVNQPNQPDGPAATGTVGGSENIAAPPPPPGAVDTGTTAPSPVTVPSSFQVDPGQAAYNASLRQSILDQLNGDLTKPETADSTDIAPAISAYTTQSQKDEQAARDQLAESAYASNGGTALQSGGFQTALASNRENAAGQRAGFVGNAVMQGQQAKRTQLGQLLNTAVQYGDTQTAQQIQSQIALLDAQLQEQGLNQSFATSNNNLGFNYASLIAQQNRDALLAGMNG